MFLIRRYIPIVFLLLVAVTATAQMSRLTEDVEWMVSAQGTAGGGDNAPFWFTSNRYGLGPSTQYSGLTRASIKRNVEADSLRFWGVGYGVDLAGAFGKDVNRFVIQQAYIDIQWKMLRLSLGQKERVSEFKNRELSTGGLTLGMNCRPLPMARFELPEFWYIPGTRDLFAIKGHIAYGWYTDGDWQTSFNAGSKNIHTSNSKFHSKALFVRIGNAEKFPLMASGGIEMSCQFGGKAWNLRDRGDHGDDSQVYYENLDKGFSDYWHALIPGGSDSNDGDFANVSGNQLGSWHARLDWQEKEWGVGVYYEHFFEDHSQMFMQYAWKDMMLGVEAHMPKNRFVSSLVYEYLTMKDQSGPIYHDKTPNIPVQISALDGYYNHHVYGAWQHVGYTMGNPLILSPIYNSNGSLSPRHNRVRSHHIGLTGQPCDELRWRFMYTHEMSLGTYSLPTLDPEYGNFYLLEATYSPRQIPGFSVTASYGRNSGQLLGESNGGMLTVTYSGWFNRTH